MSALRRPLSSLGRASVRLPSSVITRTPSPTSSVRTPPPSESQLNPNRAKAVARPRTIRELALVIGISFRRISLVWLRGLTWSNSKIRASTAGRTGPPQIVDICIPRSVAVAQKVRMATWKCTWCAAPGWLALRRISTRAESSSSRVEARVDCRASHAVSCFRPCRHEPGDRRM